MFSCCAAQCVEAEVVAVIDEFPEEPLKDDVLIQVFHDPGQQEETQSTEASSTVFHDQACLEEEELAELISPEPAFFQVFPDPALVEATKAKSLALDDPGYMEEKQSTKESTVVPASPCSSADEDCFAVSITKDSPEGMIGLEIVPKGNEFLKIKQIKRDGPVRAWNAAHVSNRVKAGDRIVEVNGVRGDADAMLSLIARTQHLAMTIERPW